MFQSFSGSSRRPRQVNLSGQDLNPFAASSWAPTASGTQKTLAAAQQERQQRQLERERQSATRRIQRIWRGHKARRDLADLRRAIWDHIECEHIAGGEYNRSTLFEELRLLVSFFDYRNSQDMARLGRFSDRFLQRSRGDPELKVSVRPYLPRLVEVLLEALFHHPDTSTEALVWLLTSIAKSDPIATDKVIERYYATLSKILVHEGYSIEHKPTLREAIAAPLIEHIESEDGQRFLLDAYIGLAFSLLTSPNLAHKFDGMKELAAIVDVDVLSKAMLQDTSISALSVMNPESRLWLLSHFICLHNLRLTHHQEPSYLRALSTILSLSANDIFGRIEVSQLQTSQDTSNDEEGEETPPQPLPEFIRNQVVSLVNKDSITGLLSKFDSDYFESHISGMDGDASLLASYALTLLRTFPTLGEEIRMWLYQASVTVSGSGAQVPAVKLFWRIMKGTSIFAAIGSDSRATLDILKKTSQRSNTGHLSPSDIARNRDWRTILLFLELYAFALRFTDDEEFLSGGEPNINEPGSHISRSRESALPLRDVKLLTIFLKNLTFTMYFSAAEILQNGQQDVGGSLASHFSINTQKNNRGFEPSSAPKNDIKKSENIEEFLGIAGMTYDYVRNIVTRVMRMLYERDSRRRFLPHGHWLMTSKFDMEGFIPDVVAEEERRRQISEEGAEDEGQDDYEPSSQPQIIGGGRATANVRFARLAKEQERKRRAFALATVGPRLEILQHMPYAIPFKTRVQIFRQFTFQDQLRRRNGNVDPDMWRLLHMPFAGADASGGRHHARIRRGNVLEDAFDQFYSLGEGLKEPIQITFVDKFDTVEAGIDGGGVTKEFLTTVTNEAFRSENGPGLFVTNDQNLLYPNPTAIDQRKQFLRQGGVNESDPEWNEAITHLLRRYEFLGRVIGKCLYESILVDIGFAGFFLLKWASTVNAGSTAESRYQANINDLRDLDESLYQGLLRLKNYPGNVESFGLDFTIDDVVSPPGEPVRTMTRELIPNGAKTVVTNDNRVLYISLVARHRLHTQPIHQTRAFLRGLSAIIQPSWLSMFNQTELQTLIGGDITEIDVDDLRRNTMYSGVYVIGDDGIEHPTIRLFWQVMKQFNDQDRRKVLKYVTSTPRSPLLGFAQLNPRFTIRDAGGDEQRLPSASTCINLLKLPRYTSAKTMSEKLLYAINSGAGFDLS